MQNSAKEQSRANSRPLKFRAWNKENEEFVKPDLDWMLYFFGTSLGKTWPPVFGFTRENLDKYIFLQFTGLKDKNGKEIYEGDVLRCERSGGTCFGVVEWWENREYRIIYKLRHDPGKPNQKEEYLCSGWIESDHEVIGNIYKNPELLK
jgi:uncharacterized phage protein (TIGR01671 family)